ncbi:eukaryotic translation initiation factor 2C 2 [Massariosphaeria phaeospora]|uniref:Eukaryotic translation initiation factor 2C 2 n=1 Tax=Massariosphaeria phaeospora TaxID=100035 RepID=A0A7C8I8R7_9PLEO|nr:eukaryotic translation initiation factor 2C 2 [Massariosphaeria phaeospora]
MAGASKRRAQAEKQAAASSASQDSSSAAQDTQRSTPKSIPRLDGNKDPMPGPVKVANKNRAAPVDYFKPNDLKNISDFLGLAGWYTARGYTIPDSLPARPAKLNTNGREIGLTLNTFNVIQAPNTIVHQYDVAWGASTDQTKRVLVKKIWNSKAVKNALGEPDNLWVYDGNKLAWSGKRIDRNELRIKVDLDEEEAQDDAAAGKPVRKNAREKKNIHELFVRHTRQVDFAHLTAFLDGHASWSADCIDTINFLDHVMREEPSRNYTQIKKSFFQRGEQRFDLGGGVEAFKGVFASLRPVLNDSMKKSLSVNVDVANGTFWRAQELTRAVGAVFNCGPPQFQQRFKDARRDWRHSQLKKDLGRFRGVGVTAFHNKEAPSQWTIDTFENMDVHEAKFTDKEGKDVSLYNYFKDKYRVNLAIGLPVVRMRKMIRGKKVYLPMDVLKIDGNQRYNSKLSDVQTSNMIKFAVTLPKERWAAVMQGVKLLNWSGDRYLSHYGLQINPTASKVKARILPSPAVHFAAGSQQPTIKPADLTAGRWRLDGRKFAMPNEKPIGAWGVCVIQGRGAVAQPQVAAFVEDLVKIYESHGGKILAHPKLGKKPWMGPGNLADGGELVAKAYNATGNYYQAKPMFMVFIVNDRNVDVYRRIKKSCDIRFGIASQVLQAKHVMSKSPQYISNVCMKINAKLGGATAVAKSVTIPKIAPKSATIPTMIVGADVSHPAPGANSGEAASFAAISMSCDSVFAKYWADVQTNGNRVEMVTTANIHDHFSPMAQKWMQRVGRGMAPQRVLYIRDGVSEGQYAAVLEEEVRDMKEAFKKIGCKEMPKFTVVIAGKRHHIRFFPDAGKGDRNGNPIPGTLVETGCTHPFEFDFYLCAHSAIKGTARPIHYQCILNEGNYDSAELQQFIFEHSYQYVRSTTPVSLHPAVYYAHLAADRSRAHLNDNPVSSGKKEAKADAQSSTGSSSKARVEIAPLHAMNNSMGLKESMWFV